ncbi:MAG: hypothetical protein KF683_00655 [Rubrivivax sp.]|nr:hypothetical protein [Rubrivivax sp.]
MLDAIVSRGSGGARITSGLRLPAGRPGARRVVEMRAATASATPSTSRHGCWTAGDNETLVTAEVVRGLREHRDAAALPGYAGAARPYRAPVQVFSVTGGRRGERRSHAVRRRASQRARARRAAPDPGGGTTRVFASAECAGGAGAQRAGSFCVDDSRVSPFTRTRVDWRGGGFSSPTSSHNGTYVRFADGGSSACAAAKRTLHGNGAIGGAARPTTQARCVLRRAALRRHQPQVPLELR